MLHIIRPKKCLQIPASESKFHKNHSKGLCTTITSHWNLGCITEKLLKLKNAFVCMERKCADVTVLSLKYVIKNADSCYINNSEVQFITIFGILSSVTQCDAAFTLLSAHFKDKHQFIFEVSRLAANCTLRVIY